jgi:ATP-dependent helicase HrpB
MSPPTLDSLPIDLFLDEAHQLLDRHQNLVVVASPGAGKTTRLPAFLSRHLEGAILVLEPRRMAAIAAASRVAEEQGWELGNEVGYQVRFANKTSAKTRLFFLTEALLSRKLAHDPELAGVECVILDEFHERSLHVDLALGLLRELQELGRPMKLVVMSATLDSVKIAQYLGSAEAPAPVLDVPGKLFPLEIQYQKGSQLLQTSPKFFETLLAQIKEAERNTQKDILVFLPGVGEIDRAQSQLESWASEKKMDVMPLHGSLSLESQRQALKKGPRRRILLSTNIAESSVTVDGVGCVIDSGLSRSMKFDVRTGFSRLEIGRISRSSAQQRAGRAARQFPGVCYRMWNKMDEVSMPPQDIPEILRSELSESLLFLAAQGVRNFEQFSWFEKPGDLLLNSAIANLQNLGGLNPQYEITTLGRKILQWPLPPRLAKLMLVAIEKSSPALGADIAAILQERDFLQKQSTAVYLGDQFESDLLLRLEVLTQFRQGETPRGVHRQTLQTVDQASRQILALTKKSSSGVSTESRTVDRELTATLLLSVFADRLCRRRPGSGERALMVGGRGVRLAPDSVVKTSEFFLALNGVETLQNSETFVGLASGLEKTFLFRMLREQIEKNQTLTFDRENGRFYLRENKAYKGLVLEEGSVSIAKASEVKEHLPQVLSSEWAWVLKDNEDFSSWIERFSFLVRRRELLNNKDLQEELALYSGEDLFSLDQKTTAFTMASSGEMDFFSVARKNLVPFFEMLLSPRIVQALSEHVPACVQVPSGSSINIHYRTDRDPYIEVRIQEVFGWKETPKLMNGNQPLTLSLLGPNYRPMQITSNLESFWKTAYAEVRRELRLRYPKHSWPEDPTTAKAVAKGRSSKS